MQRKLVVGAVADPLEREADEVAAAVVSRLGRGASVSSAPQVARRVDPDAGGPDGGTVRPETAHRIDRMRGGGSSLTDDTRGAMESAIGADFGSVRVHTGSESSALNEELGARAFTVGSDVFVRRDSDVRDTALMAHELAHVVQQDATVRREPSGSAAPTLPSGMNLSAQMSICSAMVTGMRNQVVSAATLLGSAMPLAAQAIMAPQMIGALIGTVQPVVGMLNAAKMQHTAALNAWKPLKPLFSGSPFAPIADMFDRGLAELEWKFNQWIAMAASIGPGGMATIAQLTTMMHADTSMVAANGGIVLRPAAVSPSGGGAAAPASPAPPPAQPVAQPAQPVAQQPAQPVAQQPAQPEAQPAKNYNVYAPSQDADIDFSDDEDFLDDIVDDIVPPKYDRTKKIDARYAKESQEGSPDLPLIIAAGEKLVAEGKVASMHDFMIKNFGWTAEDVDKYVVRKEKSKVAYLDEEQRKAYALNGGSTLKQGDSPDAFDTSAMFSKHSGKGFGIYVMGADGTIYADQHKVSLFHHSSFLAGGDVAAAGEIKVVAGAVKVVTNKTGHYMAGDPELWQMLDELKSRGINLRGIEIRNDFKSRNPWPLGDAQDFWDTKKP